MKAVAVGSMRRRMMCRSMYCAMGPNVCARCAMVTGSVAMRVHVETWDSNVSNPDCVAARKLVAKMMDDDATCEYGTDGEHTMVRFAACLVDC